MRRLRVPRTLALVAAAAAVFPPLGNAAAAAAPPSADDIGAAFGAEFDPLESPDPESVELEGGGTASVIDTGPEDGIPVLYLGGTGTSATAVRLVEFHSSARAALGLRFISIDRNGYGDAEFDPEAGYAEFAETALGALDALDVDAFSIVAVSGGGPYAAAVAESAPERIRSIHLASAYTGDPIAGTPEQLCDLSAEDRETLAADSAADPAAWWVFSEQASVNAIPGFFDVATADAARAFHVDEEGSDPSGLAHEFELFCEPTTPDLSAVEAPAYLYFGDEDTTIPADYAEQWAEWLPSVVKDRRSSGQYHDVQYRHWGQVLVDLASPETPLTLVCSNGESVAAPSGEIPENVTYGGCAWAPSD